MPLHTLGLFLLADGTHAGFDKHRNRFFWEGQGNKKKYHMVKWEDICQPKCQGGLGAINSKFMNIALMAKWIWRILGDSDPSLLWLRLLKAKYNVKELFSSRPVACSPFWHSIHKIKHHFKKGVRFSLGAHSSISFWKDLWIGDTPLCVKFPSLFQKSSDSDISIAQAYFEEGWWIPFRRNLDQDDTQAWGDLVNLVEDIELEDCEDHISWDWEQAGCYSSRSMYRELCKKPEVQITKYIWNYAVPPKIKIFTWQLVRGRLPSNDHILNKHGPSDGRCALCGEWETADHIFFQCPLAQFLWSGVREMLSVSWNPYSRMDWFIILDSLGERSKRLMWIFFAAQSWALWTTRNKFTIERKFPRQPADITFKLMLSLQLWRPLQKPKDLGALDELIRLTKAFFARTSTPPAAPSMNHQS
jgi:mannosylglycoprotein endo-beta-mannosidase